MPHIVTHYLPELIGTIADIVQHKELALITTNKVQAVSQAISFEIGKAPHLTKEHA